MIGILCKLGEQRLRLFQIARVEPFREPVINGSQQFARFIHLALKTMIPLRAVGIMSSIFQIAFALLAGITPMLIWHSVLLPMNAYRLYEQTMLVRRVRKASNEGLSMDWLMPYMTKRQVHTGQILFRKGQPATEMFNCFFRSVAAQRNRC